MFLTNVVLPNHYLRQISLFYLSQKGRRHTGGREINKHRMEGDRHTRGRETNRHRRETDRQEGDRHRR